MKQRIWPILAATLILLMAAAVGFSLGDDAAEGQTIVIRQILQQRASPRDGNVSVDNLCPHEADQALIPTDSLGEPPLASLPQQWPGGGSDALLSDSSWGVIDKFVSVKNDGNVDAYVRTWFAFEMGDLTAEEFEVSLLIHRNESVWTWSDFTFDVVIDGRRYAVVRADYNGTLAPGAVTSHPSLLQVMLRNTGDASLAGRLDGNGDGRYEIKVYTLGVSDDRVWSSAGPDVPWNHS